MATTSIARGLCGCWNAIDPPHRLDLRLDRLHGTAGHTRHTTVVHAWCATCSPGSVSVFAAILGPVDPSDEPPRPGR